MSEQSSTPVLLKRPPRTEYARKLFREFGASFKLGGAGLLALAVTEGFSSTEADDRLPIWVLLLLGLAGAILAATGNLLTAEAER